MNTNTYPYFRCDFPEFNPVQEACVPVFDQDYNLVLATPTASGKTAIAECVFGYVLERGASVVYTSPLKALLREKHQRWADTPEFTAHKPTLHTGEDSASQEMLATCDMVLSTMESFYLQVVNNAPWLQRVGCLVVDEAHILGDKDRGAIVEAMMMGFTRLNPEARLLLLSGTLNNAKDVSGWVKSLNGKLTRLVCSDWQPVKAEKEVLDVNRSTIKQQVLGLVQEEYPDDQVLIFVHSKFFGKELTKFLKNHGIRSAFYRADLSRRDRERLSLNFRTLHTPVLVTTSSLAMGVNL